MFPNSAVQLRALKALADLRFRRDDDRATCVLERLSTLITAGSIALYAGGAMTLQRRPIPSLPGSGEKPAVLTAPFLGVQPCRDEQFIRFDLLRALQLHRRLVLGCAMAGLLLALTYAIVMWPVDTAGSQISLRPVQPKVMWAENDQNGSVKAAAVSAVALPSLYPSLGIISKVALPLALGGFLLGLFAAVVANKIDPHLYIAADIEQEIGLVPIAVLPDFDEVSEGVANEYLLRLAAEIEQASRKGDLHTCILTGTSRRTGVTTTAERVKDAILAMGRRSVLLNATSFARDDSPETEASTALLKQVASQRVLDDESLILIDTAPLVISAETEYLARSVDGALVVIRSGVTTRAQLLATVNSLQRLEISAVGFVLNRVSAAKADPAFRHSLHDVEKHLRNQGVSSSMWPVRWHGFSNQPPRKPEYAARECASPAQSEPVQEAGKFRTPPSIHENPKAPAEMKLGPKPEPANDTEPPWWLSPPPPRVKSETKIDSIQACVAESVQTSSPRIPAPKLPDWFWEGGTIRTGDLAYQAAEHAANATEQLPLDAKSRVERLRGLLSNVGLANLHRNRAPFLADGERSPHVTVSPPASVNPPVVQPSSAVPLVEKTDESVATTHVAATPERLSPREFIPLKEKKSSSSVESSPGFKEDEIRILPAKRGQYGSR